MKKILFFVASWLLSFGVLAASGTVSSSSQQVSVTASSNSCTDVRSALNSYYVSIGHPEVVFDTCSSNPVTSTSVVYYTYNGSPGNPFVLSSVTATPTAEPEPTPTPTPSAPMPTVIELAPFNLSTTEGGLIAVAILGVWASAFAFRAAARALSGGSPE